VGNVVLRAETQHHGVKAVWKPSEDREQAGVPAKVREKAEERDKAAVTDGKRQSFNPKQNYIEGSVKNNLVEFAPEFAVDLIDLIEQNRRNSELFRGLL